MNTHVSDRKGDVLHMMPTIRWLLNQHRFHVDAYSDDTIADALIETCPKPSDFWLRSEHLSLAVGLVTTGRPDAGHTADTQAVSRPRARR